MPNCEREAPTAAEDQRAVELAWLRENMTTFWSEAYTDYCEVGRGAIVIDASQTELGDETPFYYAPQAHFAEQDDAVSQQMADLIRDYDPERQLVAVFIRPDEQGHAFSMFQVAITETALLEAAHSYREPVDAAPATPVEPTIPELEPPDIETLLAWDNEGGCEAACPHSCWVEPDGVCSHGHQSWLLEMGLI